MYFIWDRQYVPIYAYECILANYEQYNRSSRYKIIVFYPGHREDNNFNLFDRLDDQHTYRATLLIND